MNWCTFFVANCHIKTRFCLKHTLMFNGLKKKNCTSYGRDAQDKIIWHANASLEVALTTRERPSCGGLLWPSKIHDFSFWSFCLETCKISQVAFTHKGMFQARKTRCPRASAKPWCANQVFRTSKNYCILLCQGGSIQGCLNLIDSGFECRILLESCQTAI